MTVIRITKQFSFQMAHALPDYDGPCRNIHGHSYHLEVTVSGDIVHQDGASENGMVMDFSKLKKIVNANIVNEFDHALVLRDNVDANLIGLMKDQFPKIILMPFSPTCENLLVEFTKRIKKELNTNIKLHHLKLRETDSSFAEYFEEDN